MKDLKKVFILSALLITALIAIPAFSQDNPLPAQNTESQKPAQEDSTAPAAAMPAVPAAPAVKEEMPAAKEMSIYGEVQVMNAAASSLTVQYYDYDSDEEKTIEIVADKDTKIENAAAIANIVKGDWVDTTYVIADGKNVAKSIIIEKEEKEEEKPADAAQTPAQPVGTPEE